MMLKRYIPVDSITHPNMTIMKIKDDELHATNFIGDNNDIRVESQRFGGHVLNM